MNLVLFVTPSNQNDIQAFVDAAATLQEDVVNGALLVVHHQALSNQSMAQLIAPLRPKFKAVSSIAANVNNSHSPEGRIAGMFARFLLGGYSKFPGAWLVVDGYAVPVVRNFMQEAEKQHNSGGGYGCGRGTVAPGSITPVGPVSLSFPGKDLKSLRSTTQESWRARGRYLFARCKWLIVPPEQYLFSISPAHVEEKVLPAEPLPVADVPPVPPPVKREDIPLPVFDPIPEPQAAVPLEELSRDQLFALAVEKGLKPHHASGAAKLIQILTA